MSNEKKVASDKRAKALAALQVEREGYVRADNKDRVAEVDASIRALRGDSAPAGRRSPRSAQSEA